MGPQGTGKSLLAQCLYVFRALPELIPLAVAATSRRSGKFTAEPLIRNLFDGLRSNQRAFAGFANDSVTIRWSSADQDNFIGVGVYNNSRRVRPDRHLEALTMSLLKQRKPRQTAIFIPTERLFYSQVRSPLAFQLLALPATFTWFSDWMQRATDVFESWKSGIPEDPRARWVRARATEALHGEAYRHRDTWKWRFPKVATESHGTLDLDMASSGQRATWPIVLLAEALLSMEKKGSLAKNFALYVEEPEIHLHPEAQVAVVEILAYLVNAGFRVVVTTHSMTVLYALNNLIMAGSLKRRSSRRGLPPHQAWLDPGVMSAFLMNAGERPRSLIDPESGFISEAELGDVARALNATFNLLVELKEREHEAAK